MTAPRPITTRFYEKDHPALANSLAGRLRLQEKEHVGQLAEGLASDWPDYKERCGYLRALRDAIAICEEAQKNLVGG